MANKTALIVSGAFGGFRVALWRRHRAARPARATTVTVVCLSYGERGESAKLWKKQGMTLDVRQGRRASGRPRNAAKALDVHDIQFFDLGDYPLEMTRQAKDRLVDVMRAVAARLHDEPLEIRSLQHRPHAMCRSGRWNAGPSPRPGATIPGKKVLWRTTGLSVRAAPRQSR